MMLLYVTRVSLFFPREDFSRTSEVVAMVNIDWFLFVYLFILVCVVGWYEV